ncbi:glutathione synthase [Fistulifera solaris]|uniref:Glutathione synthetase n=1 Tax=Fistulifera solaris TaxID=1519565 RepID=A0A1Z5JM49_FISSO|nr:glutathione synthase [Fistulifera solaris]|eukprot:GAX15093.1 glutathione synthase [Fistulifera solaris]
MFLRINRVFSLTYFLFFIGILGRLHQPTTALMADFNLPLDSLASAANAYASANGVQVEKKRTDGTTEYSYFECAPISLLPNAYPRAAFEQAQSLAPSFNLLVDRISRDGAFLQKTLGGGVSEADPYTAQLLRLYREIYVDIPNQHAAQADRLGIHRSDYMLHEGNNIKQVELNTIASSFAGLSSKVASLHLFLCQRFAGSVQSFMDMNKRAVLGDASSSSTENDAVPINPTMECLPAAFNVAMKRYEERFGVKQAIVLFVVQQGESNTVDQRMLEFNLFERYNIMVVRKSLRQLRAELIVDEETGAISIAEGEIAIVYYRAGYAPTDYPDGYDGVEWQARAMLEKSRATKSPNLGYHLAGTKKVQQELARPGVLERFIDDADMALRMRKAFAGLYSLGEDATGADLDALQKVLEGGQAKYVLKPQREGGGYNFYGDNLAEKIRANVQVGSDKKMKLDKSLGEYILMERLFPPEQKAILLRSGRIEGSGDSISELGCFGTIVASCDGDVVHNEYGGFLLRTKFSNVDEGGVASGFATLSSPYLVS